MAEDLSDNIDLCSTCIGNSTNKRGFIHNVTHDIVKVEETLHDFHFAQVVKSARATINRVKCIFRALDGTTSDDTTALEKVLVVEEDCTDLLCACCAQRVSTPCWACVVCSTILITLTRLFSSQT